MLLRISLLEFILRVVPESLLIILATYLFNYKKIELKPYTIASVFIAVSTYLVRMLPINYGVHTIINIIVCILVIVAINKIKPIKAIQSIFKIIIILSACEWINVAVLDKVMKLDLKVVFNGPLKKILYSTPSLVMFGIVIFLFYRYRIKTRVGLSNVCH